MARPTTPRNVATAREITTHTEATLLESFSFSGFSIAMNLRRMCGIPKYPSPQQNIVILLNSPYGSAAFVELLNVAFISR